MLVTTGTRILEFDYCVDTEAKILQTDLTWCRAADIEVGAELIGFDERVGAGHSHSFRAAVVTAVKQIRRPRVRVNTSHGSTIVSVEHRFVAREPHHSKRRWVYAQDLRPGMRMAFLAEPWEVERGWEAGYLAGFFDGEGWISRVNVGYAQNPGPVLDNVQAMLRARGFQFSQTGCNTNAHCEITNGIRDTLRFLGTIRPPRLMRKARQIWEGRRTWGKQSPVVTVTSVEFLPEDVVIAIETTTGTYISDGFFSHNCGIEAVLLGWFMRSPSFIRLAKLGVHALVASHTLKRPADLTWSDADLAAYFKAIKGSKLQVEKDAYERSKRCVHGTGYGLTVHGMVRQFPKAFPTLKHAQAIQDVYFSVAPEVPAFQQAVQKTAYDQHFLGGAARYHYDAAAKKVVGHPYGYKHTFYAVLAYQRLTESQRIWREARRMPLVEIEGIWYGIDLGEDAKRVIAFYPQSTARGVLTEAALDLFLPDDHPGHRADLYIGDAYYGRTPLRAPIHDSLLLEVPVRAVDKVSERVFAAMGAPVEELPCPAEWGIGPALAIGVDAKIGDDWDKGSMEELTPPSVASDRTVFGEEGEDQEDVEDLGVQVA